MEPKEKRKIAAAYVVRRSGKAEPSRMLCCLKIMGAAASFVLVAHA
jgi:hypothetical protein